MNPALKRRIHKRWLSGCLLFFIIACHAKSFYPTPAPSRSDSDKEEQKITADLDTIYRDEKMIHDGDLILRTGRDFTSEIMRQLSAKDKTYSHCGIASIEHDSVFVYHSIGGEWNPDQKLRRDPFETFCNPFENRGFGIFRYRLTPKENRRLISAAQKFYAQGIMFDMQFDLASDERMYCTEFVYKAVEEASNHKISLTTTTLNQIKFVAPDNLFMTPGCIQIKRITFNR